MVEVTAERRQNIAELIEPLRVEPGSRWTSPATSTPATRPDLVKKKDGARAAPDRASRCWPSTRRGWPPRTPTACCCACRRWTPGGKDGTIRHVMSGVNPQGVHVSSFKVPSAEELDHDYLWRYARAAARARRHRDLQPVALRGGPRRPRAPRGPGPAAAARGRRQGKDALGAPLPGDQRLGALPDRQRVQGGQALPEPVEGGAADPLPEADRPTGEELEVLGGRRPGTARGGTTTSRRSPRCCRRPAPRGRRGTSSRPTASGSPGICAAAVLAHTLIEIDPQYPTVSEEARRSWRGGASWRRRRRTGGDRRPSRRGTARAPRPTTARRDGHRDGHGDADTDSTATAGAATRPRQREPGSRPARQIGGRPCRPTRRAADQDP